MTQCRGHTGPHGEVGDGACGAGRTGGTQGPRARAQSWSQFAKELELSLEAVKSHCCFQWGSVVGCEHLAVWGKAAGSQPTQDTARGLRTEGAQPEKGEQHVWTRPRDWERVRVDSVGGGGDGRGPG